MSFLKYQNHTTDDRGQVHWARADRDGAPFRGSQVPLLRDEEFEELAERVYDANIETFDTSDPEQKKALQSILDASANGWFKVLCMDRKWVVNDNEGTARMYVYIEWVEPYQEISSSKLRNL
jgi:hypothetical protein